MSFFQLTNIMETDIMVIPGVFIDYYLPAASGENVRVFLYLLRLVSRSHSHMELSTEKIARVLDISEQDVFCSLNYWEDAGLLKLSYDQENILNGICFLDIVKAADSELKNSPLQSVRGRPVSSPGLASDIPAGTVPGTFKAASGTDNASFAFTDQSKTVSAPAYPAALAADDISAQADAVSAADGSAVSVQDGIPPAEASSVITSASAKNAVSEASDPASFIPAASAAFTPSAAFMPSDNILTSEPASSAEKLLLSETLEEPDYLAVSCMMQNLIGRDATAEENEQFCLWYLRLGKSARTMGF